MRVKRGLAAHRRHKKFLDAAKGFRGGRSRLYRTAREAVEDVSGEAPSKATDSAVDEETDAEAPSQAVKHWKR